MPQPGDKVYLGSILCNVHCWGIVSDIDTPSGLVATFEVLGNDGAVTFDALLGPPGPPGQNAPIVKMQYASEIDDPADLPINLLDNDADRGKTWWIGNNVYMWSGQPSLGLNGYVVKAMGTQGPPGPVPEITATTELLDPDDNELESEIVVTGPALAKHFHFKLKAPKGEPGPGGPWGDYGTGEGQTGTEQVGDTPVWDGDKYMPSSLGLAVPLVYSIPQSGFVSFSGLTTRQQISAFELPAQEFDWTPLVFGHLRAVGLELDADPLILGCEVRLGHATTGELIGRGFGNVSTWTTIVPHYSTPTTPGDAITPVNGYARVPAGVGGTDATVYCNLFNDGWLGAYVFDNKNAQLTIQVVPLLDSVGG